MVVLKVLRRFGVMAVTCALVCASVPAAAGQWEEAALDVAGTQRWYRLYQPDRLRAHAPLVLSLHGGTGSMHTIDHGPSHGWVRLADQHGFALLVPNGTNMKTGDNRGRQQFWNDLRADPKESQTQADDLNFISALLEKVSAQLSIDTGRVYVTGNSNGGLMTYRLVMEMPQRFAAAAAFIAHLPVDGQRVHAPQRPVPLLIWSGTEDKLMKYEGGEIPPHKGLMRSARDNLAWWLAANRARRDGVEARLLPDLDPRDGCRVWHKFHPAAQPGGAPVSFFLGEGGGHAMPSQHDYGSEGGPFYKMLVGRTCKDVDGADIAWEFMREYRLGSSHASGSVSSPASSNR